MIEQENTRPTEAAAVEEIGRALNETVGRAKPFAERQEAAMRNGAIGEIGTKVIEGLLWSIFMRKNNPYSSGGATNGFSVRSPAPAGSSKIWIFPFSSRPIEATS